MNKKLIKILIPVLIFLAVAGIWIIKNIDKGSESLVIPSEADFTLEATSVDLETLTSYGLPVIIDFGADSCIPCKEMYPVLVSMNEQMRGKAVIKFIDVWKNTGAADGFPVQLIPTQIFINADGTPYVPGDDMEIDFITYNYKDTGDHAFTAHQGGLTEEQMRAILSDMGVEE